MKKFLLILFLFPAAAFAQIIPVDSTSNKITYSEVVTVDGVSKDELYIRAREWFAKTFRSAQDVIQMDDKSAGKLIGKGASVGSVYGAPLIYYNFTERYTVAITVKEGRYRYEISDFTVQLERNQYGTPPEQTLEEYLLNTKNKNDKGEYKKSVKGYAANTINIGTMIPSTLKEAMSKKSTGFKSKDDF